MLALAEFTPLFGAVLICWIFSVCIHEYAHALAAYLGGDRSVRERGYLGFNLFNYIDPVTSLLIPAAFLLIGGLPLPGGAVRIDRSALRSRNWWAVVAAAGPLSNIILFLILAALLHPQTGLVDPSESSPPQWAVLLGAMCVLELWSVLFNLIPVPPLDGFGILEPYLSPENQRKAQAMGWGGLIVLYFLMSSKPVAHAFMDVCDGILRALGLPFESTWRFYNFALFGASP